MILPLLGLAQILAGCASATETACASCGGDCVEQVRTAGSRAHVGGTIDYPDYPPSGGKHNACWTSWGVHTEAVPAENWVHNLEHGGIVLLYDADAIDPADRDALIAWAQTLPEGRFVVTPAAAPMDGLVAGLAWEHRLLLGCVDTAALQAFFDANVAHAPEDLTANPSASCAM